MPKGADWVRLEERMADLLQTDKAKRTPGSGNSKGEEDVVGISTICQCKDSSNKNITILTKDIERLLSAAKLLDKFPLFASRAGDHTVLSIPMNDDTIEDVIYLLEKLILVQRLKLIEQQLDQFDGDATTIQALSNQLDRVASMFSFSEINIKQILKRVKQLAETKILNATTYNLFDGEQNAT